jgi:two-component system response regulator HydG
MKPGRFEMAAGGTLFLDEVGDIPLATQVKLLRVLETRTFERVGGTAQIEVDVRIIGATHRDLEAMMAEGTFREDFYFRLDVLTLRLPSLRERKEDIPLLARHFLETSAARSGRPVHGISRGAMDRLIHHGWPGNIRDLHNVIQRAVVVHARGEVLTESDVSLALGIRPRESPAGALNLRQRELLLAVRKAGLCTIDALCEEDAGKAGRSRRTLQNDVRALTDLGYLVWHKQGSARAYEVTPQAARLLEDLSGQAD